MQRLRRILIVDDNPTNLEVFQEILNEDFSVRTARNGREALHIAEQFQPKIVVLDVMLPGMDGYEICRRIRQLSGMCDVKIVMVSAKAMPSECEAGIVAGADVYLTKPFDESEFLHAIRDRLFVMEDAR